MLQSIKRARKVNPDDGELHEAIVGFVMAGMYNKVYSIRRQCSPKE